MTGRTPSPIVRATRVDRAPEAAFRIFTDEIGAWWPLPSHGMFGASSAGLQFVDGQLVETSTSGNISVWGEVQTWDPPHRLVFSWHPGQGAAPASEVEVLFEADDSGTRVVLEHRGWEVFGADALERRRNYVGPGAWGHVLDHFADRAEPAVEVVDTGALQAAYDRFFAEASAGGFGQPEGDGWTAEHVVAHVALNDGAMLAICQGLIHQNEVRFENQQAQDPRNLTAWIDRCGDLDGLIDTGQRAAANFVACLERLSPGQLATLVHCTLTSDGEAMLDDARPWSVIANDIQSGMHLPSHTDQLTNLRR